MSPKTDSTEHHGPGVRVRPTAGATPAAPPPAVPVGARVGVRPSLSGSLLPPRPEPVAAAAPAPTAAPATPPPPAAAPSPSPAADEVLGDEPILVVESIPDGTLFDRTPLPFNARTVTLRYDTAAVGGFVGAILMGVAFMLGRTGATSAEVRPVEVAQATPPAATAPAETEPAPRIALRTEVPFQELEPAPVTPPPEPAPIADERPTAPPAPAPAAPGAEPKWAIMAIGGIPQRNATDVVKFFEEKGFKATMIGSGENRGVLVGAYAEKKGELFETDLDKVRKLTYKDGKKPFAGAYAYALPATPRRRA